MRLSLSCNALLLAASALAACLIVPSARADDLAEALALAYQSNPNLVSQRAQLQATDEGYVQAEAGFRPTANVQAGANYSYAPESTLFGEAETQSNTGQAQLSVNQPLYTGGRTTAAVDTAEAKIRAGREQLRATEASVAFSVIQAYCDVLRDRASLQIQKDSYQALLDATNEIRARYEAGANTVTDKVQAETQLESSRALVESAQAQYEVSVAEYVAAVGRSPGNLAAPPPLPGLPADLESAFDIAEHESPTIRQAQYAEASSRAQVQEAEAARRPTISLSGQYGYAGPLQPFQQSAYLRDVSVTATLSQPLFTGGVIGSQVRQAVAEEGSAEAQVDLARRNAIQAVSQAWSQRRAAHASAALQEAAVKAAQATFDGMREEYRAGLRQTLDVLIAQENLRDAQIALVDAQHDDYVAQASLLGAVGRLEARILLQGQPLYRPEVSFRKVRNAGSVPWEIVPAMLDRMAAPPPPQPPPLPEPQSPAGPVRMTSVEPVGAAASLEAAP